MRSSLTAVDLFSGAGGVTLGFKQAGVQVIAAADIDPEARRTYIANHPDVSLYAEDLSDLDSEALMKTLGLRPMELDILTACAPCQTFSSLRTRPKKRRDPRNSLVERIADFAETFLPKAVVMENVPNLARDKRFRSVVSRLRKGGYGVRFSAVDAAEFGVPQRRRRLVLIAVADLPDKAIPLLSPEHPLLSRYAGTRTVRHALDAMDIADPHDPLNVPRTNYPPLIAQRIAAIPLDGGSRSSLPPDLQLACHERLVASGKTGAGNIYGRMGWDDVAPTLTTRCTSPSCGRFLHPSENRAITLREAACLQTFPVTYRFVGGNLAVQAQIGNAVPPRLAEAIAVLVTHTVSVSQAHTGASSAGYPNLACNFP